MLIIANLEAKFFLPQGIPDQVAAKQRLDKVAKVRLPAEMNGRLNPPSRDKDAVYRIRDLQLDMWVDLLAMSDAEIAQRWGQLAMRAITQALLRGQASEVVRYDDHAHFVAAFLADLLHGQAWSRWVYDEFLPMKGLPPGRITALLLVARPELLLPAARRLERQGQLTRLLQQLKTADVELIWSRGLGFQAVDGGVIPSDNVAFRQTISMWRQGVALEQGGLAAEWRNRLRLYLAAALPQPGLAKQPALSRICLHAARLYRLTVERPSPFVWRALAREEIGGPGPLKALIAGLGGELAPEGTWLLASLATAGGRRYLAEIMASILPEIAIDEPLMPETAGATTPSSQEQMEAGEKANDDKWTWPRQETPRRLVTAFAGLALLLPVIRDMGLEELLGKAGLYQLLLCIVGRKMRPLAWGDGAAAWLSAVPANLAQQAREQPVEWPDASQWVDDAAKIAAADIDGAAEKATVNLGDGPARELALVVLRRFSRGLRGFEQSSPGYLSEQFINLAGQLLLTPKEIEARLSHAPLGIVLHMASRDGEQGPVPWLGNRKLIITLP